MQISLDYCVKRSSHETEAKNLNIAFYLQMLCERFYNEKSHKFNIEIKVT